MHDVFDLEYRGIPVAYVDTPGRVPHIERDGPVFVVHYQTNRFLLIAGLPEVPLAKKQRLFERQGIHRALRLAGAEPGDRVRVDTVEFDLWEYPAPDPKKGPSSDGVADYPYIVTPPGRIGGWTPDQVKERGRELAPLVAQALLKKRRRRRSKAG